jgi:hypothetical protein
LERNTILEGIGNLRIHETRHFEYFNFTKNKSNQSKIKLTEHMKKLVFLFIAFLCVATTQAQIKAPQPSPTGKIMQAAGLTDITIEYSRPSAKGRKVYGGLVPFNELWRTGANGSTKVTFSEDVVIMGNKLPKATYALYAIPSEKQWTIIFHKNLEHWGIDDYKQEEDICRVMVSTKSNSTNVETFTMSVDNIKNTSCEITLAWENTSVSIPVSLNTDERMTTDIKKTLDGPSADSYYASARYYNEENKDPKQALEWINKAVEKGGEKFWWLRLKSLILAKNGDFKSAIATAERSSELATKEGNKDYVRMNAESIAEWKKK